MTDDQLKEIWQHADYDPSGDLTPESKREIVRAAMAMEREACCKALCHFCRAGVAVEFDRFNGNWWHPQGAEVPGKEDTYMSCHVRCDANLIRKRGEQE